MLTQGWVSLRGRRVLQRTAVGTCFVIVSLIVVGSTRVSVPRHGKPAGAAGKSGSANQPKLAATYGKLPMSFETNRGQTDSRVKFLSRGTGYTLFLTGNEAVLALRKPSAAGKQRSAFSRSRLKDSSAQRPTSSVVDLPSLLPPQARFYAGQIEKPQDQAKVPAPQGSVLRMRLVGGNPVAGISGMDELPGKSNYFIGNDPKKWRTHVPTYAKVKYTDVYPGVDLVYYGKQGQLEYDFVVNPGADPHQIALAVDNAAASTQGALALQIDSGGDLVVGTGEGQVRFHKPVVYQPSTSYEAATRARASISMSAETINGKYELKGDRVTFEIASYDKTKPLVIDPTLTYSTYLGGSNNDQASSIAVDASGNAYVTGYTTSADFPITPGAFETTYAGTSESSICVFVSKLNPTGTALLYSTYLGVTGGAVDGIAVDSSGNAYITGGPVESNFPTTLGAFQTTAVISAFVTKLNADGSALLYSTFLGQYNSGVAIAVDAAGDAYITGVTDSNSIPVTPGAFQPSPIAHYSGAFVSELNAAGSALVYLTYLEASADNTASAIAVDNSDNAYITGSTGEGFPTTPGAFETTCTPRPPPNSGCAAGFVTKLNATGSALVYSTYLSVAAGSGIAVDSSGNAYVTGSAAADFVTTPGAFQTTSAGGNAFVSKLNAAGSALVYSTFLGGSGNGVGQGDVGAGIAIDASGNAYVAGATASSNFPTTANAFQGTYAGGPCNILPCADAFVSELNAAGSALLYSSYLGGSGDDGALGIAIDPSNNAYVTGETGSSDFPTTAGAFQTTYAGNGDAFVAKFSFIALPDAKLTPSSLTFTSQAVGTQSPSQVVKLANTGGAPLVIEDIRDYDKTEFSVQNGCGEEGASLAPGASCTITVTFTPTRDGCLSGAIKIFDNAMGSPQEISLKGTGTGRSPIVRLEPDHPITFAPHEVGRKSEPKTVHLINSGNARLHISAIAASGDFDQTNNCRDTLAPDAMCEVWITFRPRVTGPLTGWLTFTDNAPGSPQMISLVGTGENKHDHR